MKSLTIYYDRDCGLCRRTRQWMARQPAHAALRWVAKQEVPATDAMLNRLVANDELVVIDDRGAFWNGDAAFIICLWVLRRHRRLAVRLSKPSLRPLAGRAFEWVSRRRSAISQLMGLNDPSLAEEIKNFVPMTQTCVLTPDRVRSTSMTRRMVREHQRIHSEKRAGHMGDADDVA